MNATDHPEVEASLPELDDARIDEIEDAVFAGIAHDRTAVTARRARRGRIWMGAAAAAAVIAVAAIAAPAIVPLVTGSSGASDSAAIEPGLAPDLDGGGVVAEDSAGDEAGGDAGALAGPSDSTAGRDIITTAAATVVVADTAAAADIIGDAAVAVGGYVESMNIDSASDAPDAAAGVGSDGIVYDTYPYPGTQAWISVRVPAEELPDVVADLDDIGEVTSSSISRQDVTQQSVDLDARITAAQASVDRLTELMSQAGDVSDLIAAETALSERQAMLEAYQQELELLEDQVAMSTLTVSLVPEAEQVEADPAGFADGLVAGWNGLVATMNGIVIALGFLIPWIAVVGVVALAVWGVVRLVRRRRTRLASRETRAETDSD